MKTSQTLFTQPGAPPAKLNSSSRGEAIFRTKSRMEPTLTRKPFLLEERRYGDLTWMYLPITLSSEDLTLLSDFKKYIAPLVRPHWTCDSLRYRIFEDGVSNKLFGFFQDGKADTDMVLVRINGQGNKLFVDTRTEIVVMLTLHRAGLSPPLYFVTENAMCYGYIPGRALTCQEMQRKEIIEATARTLARFHSVPIPSVLQGREPQVWVKVDDWMEQVQDTFGDEATIKRFKEVMGSLEELRMELEWLKLFLGAPTKNGLTESEAQWQACDSPCILCHNDPQPLNFVRTPDGEVVLIDMEFSGVNYPAFDIGCFFCEFAGVHGDIDYGRYPSEQLQKKWISHYLEEHARLKGEEPQAVSQSDVQRLYRHANQFALVAHFMWTLWSLIQCKISSISFDYMEYGCIRYNEYKRRKAMVLELCCANPDIE